MNRPYKGKSFERVMLFLVFIITYTFLLTPNLAHAFKLSPCLRVLKLEDGKLSAEKISSWNLCRVLQENERLPVHEHMTLASVRAYIGDERLEINNRGWKYRYMSKDDWNRADREHHTHALIYGTWWNDDPLMRTWGEKNDFIIGGFRSLSLMDSKRVKYPTDHKNCSVPAISHIGYQSHYGTLQHLHFMTELATDQSTNKERIDSTTEKSLKWIHFAYDVAIGSLHPLKEFNRNEQEHVDLPPLDLNVCAKPENIKIWTLFSRTGMLDKDRIQITPDVALGTILHIIQDSWSSSHTCRIEQKAEAGQLPLAVLEDVKNYKEQESRSGKIFHATQDLFPDWLNDQVIRGKVKYGNDPITIGAWLLSAVDQKLPWTVVEEHLRNTIFAKTKSVSDGNQVCLFTRKIENTRPPI